MGKPNKVKNQKSSLWTTTLEDIDKNALLTEEDIDKISLLTEEDIQKTIQDIKDNKTDINKPIPEIERLKKIFEPKPDK